MKKRTEGVLTVPAVAVSLLPKAVCPICSPAYAALLSSLGLGFLATTNAGSLSCLPSGRTRHTNKRRQLRRTQMAAAKHRIEIYSAGCATCKDTIEMVKRVAGSDHDVHVHDMQHGDTAAHAKSLGVRSLPAVVINGKLAGCCAGRGPDEHVLREALR